MAELAGKRALVTGAGRRVGAAIAMELGRLGMQVAVHYQGSAAGAERTCRAIEGAGGRALPVHADLLRPRAPTELIERVCSELGGLELLVPSAANFERVGLSEIEPAHFRRALGLNLEAPCELAQAAAPQLAACGGSIVFITCNSRLAPYRDYLPYQVSKAGLYQAMRVLALELAPAVRVNAVAPGTVLPPEQLGAAELEALRQRIPLGRLGSALDVARAVAYLAGASGVTGQELVVDGGRALG